MYARLQSFSWRRPLLPPRTAGPQLRMLSLARLSSMVVRPVAQAHSFSHGPTGCDLSGHSYKTGHAFKRGAMSAFAAASQAAPVKSGAAAAAAQNAICDGCCNSYVGARTQQLPQGNRHHLFGP